MDELIKQVSQRTGLPADQARMAAETVLNFLKERLPAPIAGQIDQVIGGSGGTGNIDLGGMAQGLGGMFGGNKDPNQG